MNTIASFHDAPYQVFSNFHPCTVTYEGIIFPSVETAFQAAKTLDMAERRKIAHMYPGAAKKYGRTLTIRTDWEQVKQSVMLYLLRQKFAPGTENARLLLNTGDAVIEEGNWWHDNYWGICRCNRCAGKIHENHLGRMLMQLRQELREQITKEA